MLIEYNDYYAGIYWGMGAAYASRGYTVWMTGWHIMVSREDGL